MDCGDSLFPPPVVIEPSSPWRNWSGTQEVYAQRVVRPRTLEALQEVICEVTARKGRARTVATGLSFSDVLQADDTLLEMTGLLGEGGAVLLPLESELWRDPMHAEPLVRVVCGARIRHLNATLACAGLAFENLGGYDGQTMIGAISTSTHGSGLHLPPLADAVVGLDLVSTGGKIWRLEPENGLTCPKKYDEKYGTKRTLLQDTGRFLSAVVSLGCMGAIYSVTMRVRSAFRLRERRTVRSWREVRAELTSSRQPLETTRNYEIAINPYRNRDQDFSCLVTERWLAEPDAPTVPLPGARMAAENLVFLPSVQSSVHALMKNQPRLIAGILQAGLEQLATKTDHIDDSFVVYNIGKINTAEVVSGEYFFPMTDNRYLAGIQSFLDLVEHNRRTGIYQTAPLAVRFVRNSRAPLSMAQLVPHATIEMTMFRHHPGAIEALLSYEKACMAQGGRPHWGETHLLTGKPGWLAAAYPALPTWLAAYKHFNDQGVFDNHFTERVIHGALS